MVSRLLGMVSNGLFFAKCLGATSVEKTVSVDQGDKQPNCKANRNRCRGAHDTVLFYEQKGRNGCCQKYNDVK